MIEEFDQQIDAHMRAQGEDFFELIPLLMTIPGVDERSAQEVLAESLAESHPWGNRLGGLPDQRYLFIYLSAHYRRITRRRGKKRAIVAVGHTMLVLIFHMIKHQLPYNELGDDHFDKMDKEKLTKTMVKRIERLGYNVKLELIKEKKAA